jgi:tRNA threonylcarbamoyladenosine biosynthesis protein TsaE
MQKTHIKNISELERFAREFAATLRGGDVVGLVGELGAGKTTLVQMFAKALGVAEAVKSPTFILMQIFPTGRATAKKGIAELCHVDAYRLKDFSELAAIGFGDYAGKENSVTFVEWADRVPELRRFASYREVTIDFEDADDGRIIRTETDGQKNREVR